MPRRAKYKPGPEKVARHAQYREVLGVLGEDLDSTIQEVCAQVGVSWQGFLAWRRRSGFPNPQQAERERRAEQAYLDLRSDPTITAEQACEVRGVSHAQYKAWKKKTRPAALPQRDYAAMAAEALPLSPACKAYLEAFDRWLLDPTEPNRVVWRLESTALLGSLRRRVDHDYPPRLRYLALPARALPWVGSLGTKSIPASRDL